MKNVQVDVWVVGVSVLSAFGGAGVFGTISLIVLQRKIDDHIKNSTTFQVELERHLSNSPTTKDHNKRLIFIEGTFGKKFDEQMTATNEMRQEIAVMKNQMNNMENMITMLVSKDK